MITGHQTATLLRAVIEGDSIAQASRKSGLTSAQGRLAFHRFCRRFRLGVDVHDVRVGPASYREALDQFETSPEIVLGRGLAQRLVTVLRVLQPSEVTPRYLSNIEASQLLESGLTLINVHMIESWLASHGYGLKKSAPRTNKEIEEVKRSLSLLSVYGFDVTTARGQLEHLLSQFRPVSTIPDA